ncbi:Mo25-PA [Protomyces lactucae-debilis]|uniref:Mo25-PA n=1 Tax=Protomyces lactucae-debilis TaxID=2754530 RepID=A0A1Y2FNF5_PROLT|nr:Mo25-PA [Protomyces lactucae-debilis]ORY85488.1 Mo25-PA [Protomyces lactucae-debilis]
MAFLFRSRSKAPSPADLVLSSRSYILKLDHPVQGKLAREEITKLLTQMKQVYFGDADSEPRPDDMTQLAQQIYLTDLLPLCIQHLHRFEFEARKDVVALFNALLRRQIADRWLTVEYLAPKEDVIIGLSRSYRKPETALQCGQILRECLKHERLAHVLLFPTANAPGQFASGAEAWHYFSYIEHATFDIASDAFSTFKDLVTRHKQIAALFLQEYYAPFMEQYLGLLTSSNYVWKRQSLKLLGEILLDRSNYNVMSLYIQSTDNLKLMMNLLRDRSAHIQFEAFHVFKVFVANPNKTAGVRDILVKNKEKLVAYLTDFHNDRKEDEQFADEKRFIISTIKAL